MKLLDTCFLVDLQREWVRGRRGAATRFLERHGEQEFSISVIAALEFLEGYEESSDGESFLAPFRQIQVTSRTSRLGSRIRRDLRKRGEMIGDFDILIAATAIEAELALVTNNARHYLRVDGLHCETY